MRLMSRFRQCFVDALKPKYLSSAWEVNHRCWHIYHILISAIRARACCTSFLARCLIRQSDMYTMVNAPAGSSDDLLTHSICCTAASFAVCMWSLQPTKSLCSLQCSSRRAFGDFSVYSEKHQDSNGTGLEVPGLEMTPGP